MDRDLHMDKTAVSKVRMRYGFSHFGDVEEGQVEIIKDIIIDFESRLKHSPEYLEIENLYNRLRRLKTGIGEILTVILLRRIVPGRCRFCPL
jgi:hypothetical protein